MISGKINSINEIYMRALVYEYLELKRMKGCTSNKPLNELIMFLDTLFIGIEEHTSKKTFFWHSVVLVSPDLMAFCCYSNHKSTQNHIFDGAWGHPKKIGYYTIAVVIMIWWRRLDHTLFCSCRVESPESENCQQQPHIRLLAYHLYSHWYSPPVLPAIQALEIPWHGTWWSISRLNTRNSHATAENSFSSTLLDMISSRAKIVSKKMCGESLNTISRLKLLIEIERIQ